jgi:hypothetical protein
MLVNRRIAVVLALFAHVAVAATLSVLAWNPVHAATPMPPNMKALPAADLEIDVVSGDKLLILSTTSWNAGTGPLELRGAGPIGGGLERVYQRVEQSDGSVVEREAGTFTFHVGHDHTHFDDYAVYTLTSVANPATERASTKQTFCIIDTDPLMLEMPGSPQDSVYNFCGNDIQGMSVGWGDTYTSNLIGQEIDISGLPNGDYMLEISIDPLNRILESDESDNTATIQVHLSGTNQSNYSVLVMDSDVDGCDDAHELGLFEDDGGGRDPNNVWDYYELTGDGTIDLGDTIAILNKFGLSPASPGYDPLYDRDAGPIGYAWRTVQATGPSLGIDLKDALASLQSFGHSCV